MTAADLSVPDEAIRALVAATEPNPDDGPLTVVRAIAAPVVAAELRRFADEITEPRGSGFLDAFTKRGPYNPDVAAIAARLRARAGELGGGGDTANTEGESWS